MGIQTKLIIAFKEFFDFRATYTVIAVFCASFVLVACAPSKSIKGSLKEVQRSFDYIELVNSDSLMIDLRYVTTNNFVGKNMYGDFNRAFLHQDAAFRLTQAAMALQRKHPKWRLVIYDALRPRSIQYVLWEKVKGTEQQQYVADPAIGSVHNYGLAVDLSIVDDRGRAIDMGTPYDTFDSLAQPQLEDQFLRQGRLTKKQIQNRKLLRKVMEDSGFIQLPHEWWHFDRFPKADVRARYPIVE